MINRIKAWTLFDWQCICFMLAVFLIPFHVTHKAMSIGFLGDMGSKLSVYPVLVGMLLYVYQCIKNKTTYIRRKYIVFVLVVFFWQLISAIHGLFIFPKWDAIDVDQFDKLIKITDFLSAKGLNIDSAQAGKVWLAGKMTIKLIPQTICTYGASLWVVSLFSRKAEIAGKAFLYGILASAVLCAIYSVIEFLQILDVHWATSLLATINPLLYDVASDHGWWPRLFSGNRIRSLFAEPSFLTDYMAVALPCVFYQAYTSTKLYKFWYLLLSWLFLMLCMTNSKTGMGVLIAECIFTLVFISLHWKKISKKYLGVMSLIFILLGSIGVNLNYLLQHRYVTKYQYQIIGANDIIDLQFINKGWLKWDMNDQYYIYVTRYDKKGHRDSSQKYPMDKTVDRNESYDIKVDLKNMPLSVEYPIISVELQKIESQKNENLSKVHIGSWWGQWKNGEIVGTGIKKVENKMTAITSTTAGSNQQRYGMMLVEKNIGWDHFIFGVGGPELKQGYMADYIPKQLRKNAEVQLWLKSQKTKGLFRSGFPTLSEYSNDFASYGIVGLLLFIAPLGYSLYCLWKNKRQWSLFDNNKYVFVAVLNISFWGLMISFIGNNSSQLYIYWLMLGVVIGCCGAYKGSNTKSLN